MDIINGSNKIIQQAVYKTYCNDDFVASIYSIMDRVNHASDYQKAVQIQDQIITEQQNYLKPNWKPFTIQYGKLMNAGTISGGKAIKTEKVLTGFNPKLTKNNIRNVRKLLALCDVMKFSRSSKPNLATVIAIPQTSEKFLKLYGYQQAISCVVLYAKKVKLLTEWCEDYRYISEKTRYKRWWHDKTFAKQYVWHKEVEDNIRKFCKVHNLKPWTEAENIIKHEQCVLPLNTINNLRISSNVTGVKTVTGYSRRQTQIAIIQQLRQIYPNYDINKQMIDQINNTEFYQQHPEIQLHGEFSFTWCKNHLKKIGYRITNPACNIPKTSTSQIAQAKWNTRGEMLDQLKLLGTQYDVKSSVPRVMYLLSTGHWLDSKKDLYKTIYKRMQLANPELIKAAKITKWDDNTRQLFKQLFMRTNFSNSTSSAVAKTINKYNKTFSNHDKQAFEEYYNREYAKYTEQQTSEFINDFITLFTETVNQVLGFISGSEIFYHESSIYITALKKFTDDGYQVFNVYDAFYFKQNVDISYVENTIAQIAVNYFNQLHNNRLDQNIRAYNQKTINGYLDNNNIIHFDKINHSCNAVDLLNACNNLLYTNTTINIYSVGPNIDHSECITIYTGKHNIRAMVHSGNYINCSSYNPYLLINNKKIDIALLQESQIWDRLRLLFSSTEFIGYTSGDNPPDMMGTLASQALQHTA